MTAGPFLFVFKLSCNIRVGYMGCYRNIYLKEDYHERKRN